MKTRILLLFSILLTLVSSIGLITNSTLLPMRQENLHKPSISAYKEWQSVGIMLNPGDVVAIRAEGAWFYTPREYHGPAGHSIFLSPDFYPVPYVAGGALIGRIGEYGAAFYIGEEVVIGDGLDIVEYSSSARADYAESGLLYLRINDDILSDNDGAVTVDIQVTRAENNQ